MDETLQFDHSDILHYCYSQQIFLHSSIAIQRHLGAHTALVRSPSALCPITSIMHPSVCWSHVTANSSDSKLVKLSALLNTGRSAADLNPQISSKWPLQVSRLTPLDLETFTTDFCTRLRSQPSVPHPCINNLFWNRNSLKSAPEETASVLLWYL